jgi:hypothetical protein
VPCQTEKEREKSALWRFEERSIEVILGHINFIDDVLGCVGEKFGKRCSEVALVLQLIGEIQRRLTEMLRVLGRGVARFLPLPLQGPTGTAAKADNVSRLRRACTFARTEPRSAVGV